MNYFFFRSIMKNEKKTFLVYLNFPKNQKIVYCVSDDLAQESTPKVPTNGFANFCLHLTDFSHCDKNLF